MRHIVEPHGPRLFEVELQGPVRFRIGVRPAKDPSIETQRAWDRLADLLDHLSDDGDVVFHGFTMKPIAETVSDEGDMAE